MSFGAPESGGHAWTLPEEESRAVIRHAVDLGINFFDTANVYSGGHAEEILGRALRDFCKRDEIVIATKVFGRMHEGPNGEGLSRKSILRELDASLKRLGTDYVDLYQIHRFDHKTPVEETMEALTDCVRSGKVRYIGASSMYAWQFAKMQFTAERYGWARFVSMQNHLNLIYREEEREMLPLCADLGVGIIPWSPLARGKLTRPWGEVTRRTELDRYADRLYALTEASDLTIIEVLEAQAKMLALPMAQVALAWVLAKAEVSAPIIGATKAQHLDDAVSALDIDLPSEVQRALEAPYVPRHPGGID
jgi:aryl-alcohol dehydrogenase-like predicted oxidoreductase